MADQEEPPHSGPGAPSGGSGEPKLPKTPNAKQTERDAKILEEAGADGIAAAKNAYENMGGFKKFVGGHRVAVPVGAGALTLATLAIPNQKITHDDGTPDEEKWGTGKKVAFGTGAVVTVGSLGVGAKAGKFVRIVEAQARQAAANVGREI